MTYQKFLKQQESRATALGLETNAIKILVLELSGKSGAAFYADLSTEMSEEEQKKYLSAIDEYLNERHPVQYILGYSYFYGYKMKVTKDVLIPRPETEELVGYVLQTYDKEFPHQEVECVDIGTGSGAIAIALAKEEKNMHFSASDISFSAIEVAKENAKLNEVAISFYVGNMLDPFIEAGKKFDILVSNPPYIPDDEYVEDIVKDNEPHVALFGGKDGMDFYEIILSKASEILKPHNILAFEHSYTKKEAMLTLVKKYFPNSLVRDIKDMEGKDRMTIVINK
jgi:release factor glutamine methyltransferase